MLTQFFSIGILMLLSAMLPGPDFALVTKNTLLHGRKAGITTTFGIATAILIHITYCILGLAILIAHSMWLFNCIKYLGATYLIYLGIKTLRAHQTQHHFLANGTKTRIELPMSTAFKQGFLCNLLNPKATLFFLALFTLVINPDTLLLEKCIYALEMFIIIAAWFCSLCVILSHPRLTHHLEKAEKYIIKALGIFLILFGLILAFAKL